MDANTASLLQHRMTKPQGKMRRRVQGLLIRSSTRAALELSYNESARLAMDSLLSRGLQGYQEVLEAEAEVDFLSELEKIYILENGRDGVTGSETDDASDDKVLESLSSASQYTTHCSAVSQDSLDLSILKDVKTTDRVLNQSSVEVYVPSDCRTTAMKDTVRMFIRKSTMALAIVMDSFSDTELLCDLLEASRKRNVSVHLLLDHLNLNLFISMWQDLKLDHKHFPKLSVSSVDGQTYCAKTGRKLTGQIAEAFIINDWTEVLTGSFSFSWLSWQVHRNFAVLLKGSEVLPFNLEFYRLHFKSKPVPGFVTYISVPDTLTLYSMLCAAQNDPAVVKTLKSSRAELEWKEDVQNSQTAAEILVPSSLQNSKLELILQPPHRGGSGTQISNTPPTSHEKPLVEPDLLSLPMRKPKTTFGGIFSWRGTNMEPPGKREPHVSRIQSQLTSLTITTAAEKIRRVHRSNSLQVASATHGQHRADGYKSPFSSDSNPKRKIFPDGLSFPRGSCRSIKPLRIAAALNTQRRRWHWPPDLNPKSNFTSHRLKLLPPSTFQTNLSCCLTQTNGHLSGPNSKIGSRRPAQTQSHHQRPLQRCSTPGALGVKVSPTALVTRLKRQLHTDSQYSSPGPGIKPNPQTLAPQQTRPTGLNWTPRTDNTRPRPVTHKNSFSTAFGTEQQASQEGLHLNTETSMGRSRAGAYKSAGFRGATVTPHLNKT